MQDYSDTYDVFLSYHSLDHDAVEHVAQALRKLGLNVFLDRWYLVPGTDWQDHLEKVLSSCRSVVVFLGPGGMGRWQQREQSLALDRQAHTSVFPVIPVLLPGGDPALGFLSLNTWIDMRRGLDDESLLILASAIKGEPPGPNLQRKLATAFANICPYRGLQFFREEDAGFFFGRDVFVNRLIEAVDENKFVAVVGESGSGKSSVVRAGLLPRLRRKDANKVWDIVTMVPGDRPFHSLAEALLPLLEPAMTEVDLLRETRKLEKDFEAGETKLRDAVSRALKKQPGTDSLMLIVDQWEELYADNEQERQKFIDELIDATRSAALSVVLTLRGDFYGPFFRYRPLYDCVKGVDISDMNRSELQQVIEEPARKVRLQFEPGLVDRILDKIDRGSLPLLEFVLKQLWNKREDGLLTHAAYEKLGKLQGAIATHAEEVFGKLGDAEKEIARRVFLQLVRPGIESGSSDAITKPTRRRISFKELEPESLVVVRKLADDHLIVTGRNQATGEEIVDLVHEALISEWSRLNSWIEDDLAFLRWRESLRTLMSLSARAGGKGSLLQGDLLTEAEAWLDQREADLSDSEKRYIKASRKRKITLVQVFGVIATLVLGIYLFVSLSIHFGPQVNNSNINSNPSPPENFNGESNRASPSSGAAAPPSIKFPDLKDVKVPEGVVEIPVVIHVIYRTQQENISDEQIRSQIAALNKDFRATNDDISQVPDSFKGAIADAHIEFVLATTDPQGRTTNGITRTRTTRAFFSDGSVDMTAGEQGGVAAWSSEKYLNIWVCSLEHELSSYAWPPGAPSERDGVVVDYRTFGTVANSRRVSHEIGHYLNLRHLWGGKEDCTGTDEVDDTPPQKGPNTGRPVFPHITCKNGPNGDMFMNFMDYTDVGCMFTKGQVLRMHQTLQGPRKALGTIKP